MAGFFYLEGGRETIFAMDGTFRLFLVKSPTHWGWLGEDDFCLVRISLNSRYTRFLIHHHICLVKH